VQADRPRFERGRFEPGQMLGERFRIISLLGKGGMTTRNGNGEFEVDHPCTRL